LVFADLCWSAWYCCRSMLICPVLLQICTNPCYYVEMCIGFCRSVLIYMLLLQICADLPCFVADLHKSLMLCANLNWFLHICSNMHCVVADLRWSALCFCRSALILAVLYKYALFLPNLP
jgi:hypothetical protein